MGRATFPSKQWVENRREVINARMNDLNFFGAALEHTPLREQFWPAYEGLADTLLSLKQAIIICMEANETSDTGKSAWLDAARRHVRHAALHLFLLLQDPLTRQSVQDRRLEVARLHQLRRRAAESHAGLEAAWDALLKGYEDMFENIRLAHVAHPTGGMDQ